MTFRDFLERYGVTLAIVGVVALLLALLPGNAPEGQGGREFSQIRDGEVGGFGEDETLDGFGGEGGDAAAFEGGGGEAGTAAGRRARGGSQSAGSGRVATAGAGGGSQVIVGEGPCRPDKRQAGISKYMPPCLRFTGGNGGATSRGVHPDKIVVVRYIGPVDPGTKAILESGKLKDTDEKQAQSYEALRRYYNQHYETYAREVQLVNYTASGELDDDEAMKRDALRIANDIKAFAVITGTPEAPIPYVLAQELAQRGVVCVCTTSRTSAWYRANPPYIFSTLPTITEYSQHIAEVIGKRLAGQKATWAGDELNPAQRYRDEVREFGLIYIEGYQDKIDPDGRRAKDGLVAELAKHGVKLKRTISYTYNPGRNQQDVTNIIAQMKSAGVTTVIPYVDPLYPILFTQEATRQQYYPEWFISGTGLMDTTTGGRLYDQNQWRHAYGVSPLWVTWVDEKNSAGWREYHHGMPGRQDGDEGVLINIYRAYFETLFQGIHMAGPNLTPDTFAQGVFSYPATGGSPALPLRFRTRTYPTEIKDFTEVWYKADERGKDERGEDGFGMVMKANMGKRYRQGEWPTSQPDAFKVEGAIAVSDNAPGGGDPPHEQDGHRHSGRCLSCG